LNPFVYKDRSLHCDGVPLADIAAKTGTPCYVYSADTISANFRAYDDAFGAWEHTVCYAVKANSNLAILRLLAQCGSGFDIVSGGELFRVIKAGGDPAKVVFSGVGKTAAEVDAALQAGILAFNCESEPELALIDALAHRRGVKARVALRVNPNIETDTHHYISTGKLAHKFGIDIGEAEGVYERASHLRNIRLEGVSCHIGSQLMDSGPVLEAIDKVLELIARLRASGVPIRHIDVGGGLGVAYKPEESTPRIADHVRRLCEKIESHNLAVMVEPGRSIVGAAGALITTVLYRKNTGGKEFVIVDAAMNDLIRPALYGAHHEIVPLRERAVGGRITADVVGPVCETGDFLARDRDLPEVLPGDTLAVLTAGAYGFVLSSTYNARPRPVEVMVEGDKWRVVRARETYEDLLLGEV
jgi:diaminopimelate decarboxylase